MKFHFEKILVNTLVENRHFLTDDVHYNSLVTSILINEPIKLVSLEHFINLDTSVKKKIINDLFFIDFIHPDGLTSFFNSKHQGGARCSKVKRTWEYITTVYIAQNANSTMLVLTHV